MNTPTVVASADDFPEDWYELADDTHFWMRWRLAVLAALLKEHGLGGGKRRALDIGCGAGTVQRQIEGITDWTVDGTDLNRIALARNAGGRGAVMDYNIFDRRADLLGSYDAAVLFDVLEHIDDDRAFLGASLDHLRPGGLVLVNVPALQAVYSRYDEVAGHVRRYGRAEVERLLAGAGLQLIDCRFWGMSMVPIAFIRKAMLRNVPVAEVIRRGFHPPSRLADMVLSAAMRVETALLVHPPIGTSIMALAAKPS